MTGMRVALLVLLLATGCSTTTNAIDAARAPDAAAEVEAAIQPDATTPIDAHAGTDAFAPARDAFVGSDAWAVCDLYTNVGCNPGDACRFSDLIVHADAGTIRPQAGPAQCESAGALIEENGATTSCMGPSGTDRCGVGLYCEGTQCRRYCDATHNTCHVVGGSAQHCDLAATPPHCVF